MATKADLLYLGINVPTRNNVREPLADPEIRLVRPNAKAGTIVKVRLNEAQLIQLMKDATKALETLFLRRDATVPASAGPAR